MRYVTITTNDDDSYGVAITDTLATGATCDFTLTNEQVATLDVTHKIDTATKTYREMTADELAEIASRDSAQAVANEMAELKSKLEATDYKTTKVLPNVLRKLITAGVLVADTDIAEYLALDEMKETLRVQINALEDDDLI